MTIKKTNKISDDKKMSYREYKQLATANDVAKMRVNLKPRIWENIPLIGCIGYLIRITLKKSDIDRGPLRREMTKYQIIMMFCTIFIFNYIVLLTPWMFYLVAKLAVDKTERLLNSDQI